jgi:hypothetical protein
VCMLVWMWASNLLFISPLTQRHHHWWFSHKIAGAKVSQLLKRIKIWDPNTKDYCLWGLGEKKLFYRHRLFAGCPSRSVGASQPCHHAVLCACYLPPDHPRPLPGLLHLPRSASPLCSLIPVQLLLHVVAHSLHSHTSHTLHLVFLLLFMNLPHYISVSNQGDVNTQSISDFKVISG